MQCAGRPQTVAVDRKLGLGRLPGDIRIETEGGGFYLPIVTCLIISALLSLVLWFLRR